MNILLHIYSYVYLIYVNIDVVLQDTGSGETERKIEALVFKMSSCFLHPARAKDCFQKLKELRDNGVFSVLEKFLKEKSVDSDTIKVSLKH